MSTLIDQVLAGLQQGITRPLTSARNTLAMLPAASAGIMGGNPAYNATLQQARQGQGVAGMLADPTLYLAGGAGAVDAAAAGAKDGIGSLLARALSADPKPLPTPTPAIDPAQLDQMWSDVATQDPVAAAARARARNFNPGQDVSPYDLDPRQSMYPQDVLQSTPIDKSTLTNFDLAQYRNDQLHQALLDAMGKYTTTLHER